MLAISHLMPAFFKFFLISQSLKWHCSDSVSLKRKPEYWIWCKVKKRKHEDGLNIKTLTDWLTDWLTKPGRMKFLNSCKLPMQCDHTLSPHFKALVWKLFTLSFLHFPFRHDKSFLWFFYHYIFYTYIQECDFLGK